MAWKKKTPNSKSKKEGFGIKKLKDSVTKTIEDVKEEVTGKTIEQRVQQTSRPDELMFSVYSWVWGLIFITMFVLIAFAFSLTNPKFILFGLLLLVAYPFIAIYCLIHMIPTIKIFGITVFDRKKLSLKHQISFGRMITKEFMTALYKENPYMAYAMLVFVGLLIVSVLMAFA